MGGIAGRGKVPIVVGGTGLYLRALLEGLAPAPGRDEELRARLRARAEQKGLGFLHRLLGRLDPEAAARIHAHDVSKLVRSLEVVLLGRRPQLEQWSAGREPLRGFRVLRLGLAPERKELCRRLDERAAWMFAHGLLEETEGLMARFGAGSRALGSLGYAQAVEVLGGRLGLAAAVAEAQAGHRQDAKRQLTWFRRDPEICWLPGFGDDAAIVGTAMEFVRGQVHAGAQLTASGGVE